jgi:hypothetical protein
MYKKGDKLQNERLKTNYKYQVEECINHGAYGPVYKVKRVYETHRNFDVEANLTK